MKLVYSGDKLAAAVIEGEEIDTIRRALKLAGRLDSTTAKRQEFLAPAMDLSAPAPNEDRPA